MILRVFLVLMMAVGAMGLLMVGWIVMHPAPDPKPEITPKVAPPPMVSVLVASKDLEAGTLLAPSMIATQNILVSARPKDAQIETIEARRTLTGALLKRSVGAGTPLLPSDVIAAENRGFLAAILQAGDVAETISINPETGVGGLIWPGDHVDVLVTRTQKQEQPDQRCLVSTQLLFSDRRVLAIDRHLTRSLGPGFDEKPVRTATLELTPQDVPKLTLATHVGEVSLTVRSALSGTTASPAPPAQTWSEVGFNCRATTQNADTQILWDDDVFPSSTIKRKAEIRVFAGQSEVRSYAH